MGPAVNIISPCALSLRLSLSRQREERSRGAESLFPLSSPLSKTTGSGSGFLEMSAFVCCVTAAALGRSSSDEVMHKLDEQAEWERREAYGESSLGMDLYFNFWFISGKCTRSLSATPRFTWKPSAVFTPPQSLTSVTSRPLVAAAWVSGQGGSRKETKGVSGPTFSKDAARN